MFMTKYGLISDLRDLILSEFQCYKSLKNHGLLDLISMQNGLFSSQSFSRVEKPAWDLRARRASFARQFRSKFAIKDLSRELY